MKKKLTKMLAAFYMGAAVFVTGCASSGTSLATSGLDKKLVQDSSVVSGKLENGMTYMVKKNGEPKNRIVLRLVLKAGSANEEENERGVAHLIEHMAFNGSEHFSKNEVVDYFEKLGMSFGEDLNAHTSYEETVYKLTVPADDPEVLKTAMTVLYDWACAMKFDAEELEKEKGTVSEEWRGRALGLSGRLQNDLSPFMLEGTSYAEHRVIGDINVIKNVTREQITAFYKKWYHPELMSVIVVGDADVKLMEKTVKEIMGSVSAAEEKLTFTPSRTNWSKEKQIKIITDKEQKYPVVNVCSSERDYHVSKTYNDMLENMKKNISGYIFSLRANEIVNSPDSPCLSLAVSESSYSNFDAYEYLGVVPKEGKFIESMKLMFDEYERMKVLGVTDSEVKRIKSAFLADIKNTLSKKDNVHSVSIAGSLVSSFTEGYVYQSTEDFCKIYASLLSTVTTEDINEYIRNSFADRGTKMIVVAPENYSDLPSEAALMDIWVNYRNEELVAYEDDSVDSLMERPAAKAKIVSKKKIKTLGMTEYELSNGIKIATKKLNVKKNEIDFYAASKGGSNYISDEDYPSYRCSTAYAYNSGFNGLTKNQFIKFTSDKNFNVNFGFDSLSDYIKGASTVEDFEYMLQFVNCIFTKRQYDENQWDVVKEEYLASAKNHGTTPGDVMNDKYMEIMYGNNDVRNKPFDMDYYNKMNKESAKRIVEQRFANPADFVYIFAGDFDEKKLLDLCCVYLGTMPTTDEKEETKYIYNDFPKGKTVATVKKGQDEQGSVFIQLGGELPAAESLEKDFEESYIISLLGDALDIRLREVIREDLGGTYGVSASSYIDGDSERFFRVTVQFGCDPSREEELSAAVFKVFEEFVNEGVSDEIVQKLREPVYKNREENLRSNWWWIYRYDSLYNDIVHPEWYVTDIDRVAALGSAENIHSAAKKYLSGEDSVIIYLRPENK